MLSHAFPAESIPATSVLVSTSKLHHYSAMSRHAKKPRTKRFTIVLNDKEHRALMAVAEHDNRSAADWIRMAVLRAHEELKGGKAS